MKTQKDKQLSDEEKKELVALKARLAELETVQSNEETKSGKIELDDYIPVVSLLPYRLNLSTREGGNGDIKRFYKFGEVKNILYKDLVDILEVNRSFMEAGYFYILNPDVIRRHGLDEVYSKILTKEKIEEIINNTNSEHCIELYNSANKEQQRIIIELLIDKVKQNPDSVNLNTVDKISRISKIDILGKAEESKQLAAELAEENK